VVKAGKNNPGALPVLFHMRRQLFREGDRPLHESGLSRSLEKIPEKRPAVSSPTVMSDTVLRTDFACENIPGGLLDQILNIL